MKKLYIVSVICAISFLGTMIPSLISMPVQAEKVDCNKTPWAPQCTGMLIPLKPGDKDGECGLCPFGDILDYKDLLVIDHDWNATVSLKHNPNSVTLSVNIPNVIIDAIGPKQENFSMIN
jgi:hypothetical protein